MHRVCNALSPSSGDSTKDKLMKLLLSGVFSISPFRCHFQVLFLSKVLEKEDISIPKVQCLLKLHSSADIYLKLNQPLLTLSGKRNSS